MTAKDIEGAKAGENKAVSPAEELKEEAMDKVTGGVNPLDFDPDSHEDEDVTLTVSPDVAYPGNRYIFIKK